MKYLYYILRLWFTPKPVPCSHQWKTLENISQEITRGSNAATCGILYTVQQQCTKCGLHNLLNYDVRP